MKAANTKKPKSKPTHPTVNVTIEATISNLKERTGSSLIAIKKYIAANYKVDVVKLNPHIKKSLVNGVDKKTLIRVKGKGASGSFKLGKATDKPEKSKKRAAKKTKESKAPKAKKAKKETKEKTPKKAEKAKEAKEEKKSVKKATKSTKAKKAATKKVAPKKAEKAKKATPKKAAPKDVAPKKASKSPAKTPAKKQTKSQLPKRGLLYIMQYLSYYVLISILKFNI